jgi:hypothetical protein
MSCGVDHDGAPRSVSSVSLKGAVRFVSRLGPFQPQRVCLQPISGGWMDGWVHSGGTRLHAARPRPPTVSPCARARRAESECDRDRDRDGPRAEKSQQGYPSANKKGAARRRFGFGAGLAGLIYCPTVVGPVSLFLLWFLVLFLFPPAFFAIGTAPSGASERSKGEREESAGPLGFTSRYHPRPVREKLNA